MSPAQTEASVRASAPEASAAAALALVEDGQTLGLGTGRAASAFVQALARRMRRDGLRARGVATSEATAALARDLGIPLLELADAGRLDTTFDGADEVDPQLDVIKGYGGALVREKIVAASSDRLVILVGEEKLVAQLGSRGKLPVEVIPFAEALASNRLRALGLEPALRLDANNRPYRTDNGHSILDCRVATIEQPARLEREIGAIPGVLDSGLFVGMADAVVIEREGRAEIRWRE